MLPCNWLERLLKMMWKIKSRQRHTQPYVNVLYLIAFAMYQAMLVHYRLFLNIFLIHHLGLYDEDFTYFDTSKSTIHV